MNVQLSSVSESRKTLVVTLDQPEVEAEHKAVLAEYVRQARLPGFRPGKAPVALVTKRFTKEIDEEFKQKVVTKAYRGALEKEKLEVLNVVGEPSLPRQARLASAPEMVGVSARLAECPEPRVRRMPPRLLCRCGGFILHFYSRRLQTI